MTREERIAEEVRKAIRAERARYAREWRQKNPEKQKAIIERYWKKKLAQAQDAQKQARGEGSE